MDRTPIPAGLLGNIHRLIRHIDQILRLIPFGHKHGGNSDADRDFRAFTSTEIKLYRAHCRKNPFGEMNSPLGIRIGQDVGKLLAAPAATVVQRSIDALCDGMRHGNQGIIAAIVAVLVIKDLEMIDVDKQRADGLCCSKG